MAYRNHRRFSTGEFTITYGVIWALSLFPLPLPLSVPLSSSISLLPPLPPLPLPLLTLDELLLNTTNACMRGESWLAVKESLTHHPRSQGWASL